jgi:hypothetical protein
VLALDVWNQNNFMCKNYILNILDNTQYDVYSSIKSVKALWKVVNKKFKVEVAIMKKFIIGNFLDFKMVNSKIIMGQVQELQLTLFNIYSKNMVINEYFQETAIIVKLSLS